MEKFIEKRLITLSVMIFLSYGILKCCDLVEILWNIESYLFFVEKVEILKL